ncbi:MAG TPA: pitrilysin family protein [Nitrospinota bacterium]|nr:pitrilysin family protein [Nitrospinota bacterium]
MREDFLSKIFKISIFLFLFVVLLLKNSDAETDRENPSIFGLQNGMKVILLEDHSSPVVALNVWVNVGSADEKKKEAGLSHVYEHMLFKGTKKRGVGEIAKEVEAAGGNINASTSYDYTIYYIVIASRYLDTALDILSDAIINPTFDPKELERELDVILEEVKRAKDLPERELHDKLFSKSFRVHPYGKPIIGYEQTIKSLTRKKLLEYFDRWYVPENMFLVVTGDFDKDILIPKVKDAFGRFKKDYLPERERLLEPTQDELRNVIFSRDVKKARLSLAFHIPEATHQDTYALDVLALILGQGESSRLFQRVKIQKELANSIYSYALSLKDPGIFLVEASLEKAKVQDALKNILEELFKLKQESVSSRELKKAKINLKSDFIYKKETMQGQARSLGFFHAVFGDISYQKKYIEEIDKVSAKDIMRVAGKYLKDTNMTVGILLPKDTKEFIDIKDIKRITKDIKGELEKRPSKQAESEIIKKKLDNGLTLLIKQNHGVPIVAMRGVFLGGVRFEVSENNGVSNFVAEMFTKGTKTKSSLDIANEIESIAGSVSGFSGRNSLGVEAVVLSQFFDKGIELFADLILNPSFDNEELEKKRREIIYNIQREEDNLIQSTAKIFYSTLFKNHPYGMTSLGTINSVKNLSRNDLKEFYQKYIIPNNMVLSIVGDINSNEVIKKVETLFGKWRSHDFIFPHIPKEKTVEKVRVKTKRREKKQTHIMLGFLGTSMKGPDRYPLEVLNSILSGQGGRLFIELRDKESLAYTVTSFNRLGIEPGYFGVYIATSPEKEEQAIKGIKRELRKIVEREVSVQEIERAKKSLIGDYEIGLQRYSAQAADMGFNEIYGLGFDEFKRYYKKISKVTTGDVLLIAKKYLNLDAYILAVIRP